MDSREHLYVHMHVVLRGSNWWLGRGHPSMPPKFTDAADNTIRLFLELEHSSRRR